jgi:hypothetical protein
MCHHSVFDKEKRLHRCRIYGRGMMSCRTGAKSEGPWSASMMMQFSGGSFELQASGQARRTLSSDLFSLLENSG